MAEQSDEIDKLNRLAATMVDSVHGYRHAAKNDVLGFFKDFFLGQADERNRALDELRTVITQLGGTPASDESSRLGRAHSRWLGFKSVVLAHDVRAILDEVKRGEHYLIEKFEEALDDASLGGSARVAVQKAYQSVRKSFDEVSRIRLEVE